MRRSSTQLAIVWLMISEVMTRVLEYEARAQNTLPKSSISDQIVLNVKYFTVVSERNSCALLVENDAFEGDLQTDLSDFLSGVVILSSLDASTSSELKRIMSAAGCLVVLIDGGRNGTWDNVTAAVNAIDVSRKLVLVAEAGQDALEELAVNTRSFDTMLLNKSDATVLCQTVGSSAPLVADHVSPCRSAAGKNLTVSVWGFEPYVIYRNDADAGAFLGDGDVSGSDIDVFRILADRLGFGYVLRNEKFVDSVGSTPGMTGNVATRSSDMGIGPIFIVYNRFLVVDYSAYINNLSVKFASPKPVPTRSVMNILVPFEPAAWIGIAVTTVAVAITLVFMEWVVRYPGRLSPDVIAQRILIVLAALWEQNMPQSWYNRPRFFSVGLVLILWLLTSFIIGSSYKCNLRADLATVQYSQPIDTSEQVLALGLPVLVPEATVAVEALRTSPRPVYRQIYERLVLRTDGLFVMADGRDPPGVETLVAEGRALLATPLDLGDRFHMSQETLLMSASGFLLPKGSWMTSQVDDLLLKLQQAGIVDRAVTRNTRQMYSKNRQDTSSDYSGDDAMSPIPLDQILPMLGVLALGAGVAAAAFAAEAASHKARARRSSYKTEVVVTSAQFQRRVSNVADQIEKVPEDDGYKVFPGWA